MNSINLIMNSFAAEYLPIVNGVVDKHNNLTPVSLNIQTETWRLQTVQPTSFSGFAAVSQDEMSAITVLNTLQYNSFAFSCGEGSFGGDGFVLATYNNSFAWLFFHEYANPIETLAIKNHTLYCKNNLDIEFAIPVDKPQEITLSQPKQM